MRTDANPLHDARAIVRAVFRSCGVAAALALAGPAAAHTAPPPLAALEVYDRQDGATLPVYVKDGQRYVVGTPGHEYALRVRNLTGERVLAVMSVDGVNIVTGDTAAPNQSGYVLDAYAATEIAGWRKSRARTAAFYFTELGDSYAGRTGRPDNVGVIGLAVFRERQRPIYNEWLRRGDGRIAPEARDSASSAQAEKRAAAPGEPRASAALPVMPAPAPDAPGQAAAQAGAPRADEGVASDAAASATAKARSPLGTGHGRDETSYVTEVAFERDTTYPAHVLTVRYDRRERLVAMGVVPAPRYATRGPQPFPGLRFVPDPR